MHVIIIIMDTFYPLIHLMLVLASFIPLSLKCIRERVSKRSSVDPIIVQTLAIHQCGLGLICVVLYWWSYG